MKDNCPDTEPMQFKQAKRGVHGRVSGGGESAEYRQSLIRANNDQQIAALQRKLADAREAMRVVHILLDSKSRNADQIEELLRKALSQIEPGCGTEPEDEALARLIAVALGFLVDTFPDQVRHLTKSDCFRAADAVLGAGYRKPVSAAR